jgi:hypothetical protein
VFCTGGSASNRGSVLVECRLNDGCDTVIRHFLGTLSVNALWSRSLGIIRRTKTRKPCQISFVTMFEELYSSSFPCNFQIFYLYALS